jgi:hypothetical protein
VSWFKVDDTLQDHPKWVAVLAEARARIEARAASRAAAKDAYLAWFGANVWGAGVNCDGVIPEAAAAQIAPRVALTEDEFLDAAPLLVAAGLWHDIGGRGRRCDCWRDNRPSIAAGWIVHDWDDYQPSKQQVRTSAEKKSNHDWLHKSAAGKQLKQAVIRRDGCWCRYCRIEVRTDGDRRSPARRTFDFVDPDLTFDRTAKTLPKAEFDRVLDGVVVACGYCNAVKNNRTPTEAEMPLLPAPEQSRRDPPRSVRDSIATETRLNRDPGTGRNGSGQIGSQRDDTGQVESGREHSSSTGPASGVDLALEAFPGSTLTQRTGDPA